jgi:hypothetical protein
MSNAGTACKWVISVAIVLNLAPTPAVFAIIASLRVSTPHIEWDIVDGQITCRGIVHKGIRAAAVLALNMTPSEARLRSSLRSFVGSDVGGGVGNHVSNSDPLPSWAPVADPTESSGGGMW